MCSWNEHNCKWAQYLWIAVCTRIPKIGYEYTPNGGQKNRRTSTKGRLLTPLSRVKQLFLDCLTLRLIGCPENLVTSSHPTPRRIQKERRSQQYRGGSLNTCISSICSHGFNTARLVREFDMSVNVYSFFCIPLSNYNAARFLRHAYVALMVWECLFLNCIIYSVCFSAVNLCYSAGEQVNISLAR